MELQNEMETSSHEAKKNGNVRFYKEFNVHTLQDILLNCESEPVCSMQYGRRSRIYASFTYIMHHAAPGSSTSPCTINVKNGAGFTI